MPILVSRVGQTIRWTSSRFGQLSGIISANWDVFGAVFSSAKAAERVMSALNTLRGPIAHCSPLAEDEVVRLRLTVADWFRLGVKAGRKLTPWRRSKTDPPWRGGTLAVSAAEASP